MHDAEFSIEGFTFGVYHEGSFEAVNQGGEEIPVSSVFIFKVLLQVLPWPIRLAPNSDPAVVQVWERVEVFPRGNLEALRPRVLVAIVWGVGVSHKGCMESPGQNDSAVKPRSRDGVAFT